MCPEVVLKPFVPRATSKRSPRVKCLGLGKEHWFTATNPSCGFGVCDACKIKWRGVSPMAFRPTRMAPEE
jgi:hypothetical protein